MFTMAPLPRWRDLFAACLPGRPDETALSAPWKRGDETAVWFSRSALIMRAIAQWRIEKAGPTNFWLPDYFCNAATAALRETGVKLVFYPITPDFAPDWPACAELAAERPPGIFMLVHYFGVCAPPEPARAFCDIHAADLVEDCAHVLTPHGEIGRFGDYVFYSPHKLLALPEGALVLIRDATAGPAITKMRDAGPAGTTLPFGWIVRRALQKLMPAALHARRNASRLPAFEEDMAPGGAGLSRSRPSDYALRLLAREIRRLAEIDGRRRANFEAIAESWNIGNGEITPYRLVVPFDTAAAAEAAYTVLKARGCPVETWPDLAPEVLAGDGAAALRIRRTRILLPVHQTIPKAQLQAGCCSRPISRPARPAPCAPANGPAGR